MPPKDDTQSLRPASDPRKVGRVGAHQRAGQPKQIGPYRVLEVIGEGGMGVVYLAEQQKPIHRRVALKIIKLGMDTKNVMARFETEREALAMMNHPNVAKVFDAGATETGRPYFAMEHVPGIPITEYCDKHRLNTEERLRLFMDVCHAVQHAHQKGLIHRDLKPSNVLVTVQDDRHIAKVIDFGVAKVTQHRLTEQTVFTEQGQLIGTTGYMSPEQAEMTALDIDTRTDIYSLGVLLYELLVGARPFDDQALRRVGLTEIQRILREVDPPKPSLRFTSLGADSATIAQRRKTEPSALLRRVRGDLDWIVMKCLEKDRTRRYETANGLALEIQRFLDQQPVFAGPPSTKYRLSKFVRRNRGLVGAVGAVILALAIGLTVAAGMYLRAERARVEQTRERQRAEQARKDAEVVTKYLGSMLSSADPEQARGREVTVRELLDQAAREIPTTFRNQPLIEAALRLTIGRTYLSLALYDAAEPHLRASLELRRQRLGNDHRDVGESLYGLWMFYYNKGDYASAEALGRDYLALCRRLLGDNHLDVAEAMNDLADTIRHAKGATSEVEALHREALAMMRKLVGDEHLLVAASLHNLADVYATRGNLVEAERLQRESVRICRKLAGNNGPDMGVHILNLGIYLRDQGKLEEARSALQEAVDIYRTSFGDLHPNTGIARSHVGVWFTKQGRFREAEQELLEADRILRPPGGSQHRLMSKGIERLVALYESWDAAEPGKGYAEKAAEWRAKLEEASTEATKEQDK